MLVADIGGTNARFVLVDPSTGQEGARLDYSTAEFGSGLDLVERAIDDFGVDPVAAVLALAGPVSSAVMAARAGSLTNGGQMFDAAQLHARFGCDFLLINDFEAVASAIDSASAVTAVGELSEPQPGVCAVVGPGTGLGMAYLVPTQVGGESSYRVFASEGGNADFAPVDELEQEVLALLRETLGVVRIESLVSGPGLVNLYGAVAQLWGSAVVHTEAAQITAAALDAEPVSHQCLEMFCGMLGTAAGNFALATGARGGVYLAGGILPRIRSLFLASHFRARFDDRGPLTSFNKQIPTFLLDVPEPGLVGAIKRAQRLIR